MANGSHERRVETPVRSLQTVMVALAMGVLGVSVMSIVAVDVVFKGKPILAGGAQTIGLIVCGSMAVLSLLLSFILPKLLSQDALRRIAKGEIALRTPSTSTPPTTDSAALLGARIGIAIFGAALTEGSAFLGCLIYTLTAEPWSLALPAVCLVVLIVRIPTRDGVERWMESSLNELAELRRER